MNTVIIDMKVFSQTPYGRYPADGPDNGETFRVQHLEPAIKDQTVDKVVVRLDSVQEGYEYGSSFLEESFGGLVRCSGIPLDVIRKKLVIETKHQDYLVEINEYMEGAVG